MNKALDIIAHRDEDTNEETAWGIVYEDGSVKWYDSLEEAEYYYPEETAEVVARRNKKAFFCLTHEGTPRPATDLYEPVTKDELPANTRCSWCGARLNNA